MSVRQGPWTAADVPDQSGRTAVVTGANSGIGFEAAAILARRGARTVLACRDTGKAEAAAARISAAAPGASVPVVRLDLASLDSIRAAADQILATCDQIDLLINNAGLMWPPYGKTADGFELQFGTNHLGHFALTGLVLEAMLPVPGSRVVTVSSNGHRTGRINFADLQSERRYGRMAAYAQSKLANLMFTYELQRRLHAAGAPTAALAAHPGAAFTELTRNLPGRDQGDLPGHRRAGQPERRHGRTAHPARGHRPGGGGRRVLRAGRAGAVQGLSGAGLLERQVPRPGRPAAALGRVRAAHRRDVPGVTGLRPAARR